MGAVYKKGKHWYIDYYVGHTRKRKKIGPDKRTAELALKDIEVKIAKGDYLGIYEEKKVTFKDFTEEFLRLLESSVVPRTLREYRSRLDAALLPAFANRYLSQITSKQIEEYKAQRSKIVGSKRINDELTLLQGIFHKAQEWGYTTNNPFKGVKKLKLTEKDPRFLSEEEIIRLLDGAPADWKAVIATGIYAGLRASELVNLEWGDLDFQKGTITVQNKANWTTKSKRNRTIPMAPDLLPYLKRHPRHFTCPYVFCDDAGTPRVSTLYLLRAIGRNAGITQLTPHVLRHTFASHMVMRGVDLVTVSKLLGHADIKTTMIYAHLAPDHLRLAVAKLSFSHRMDTGHRMEAGN